MEKIKNEVRLTGYAGADPVIVNFTERRMARINLGVHDYYKNSLGENVDQTQWFTLVFWNKKIALIEDIVKKGTAIRIAGKLSAHSFTDKNGEQRYVTEVIVHDLEVVNTYEL